MARWQPGGRDRLQQAALDLFGTQGFEQTTVAQIAARAGLTTRTFFRHFADKREVLFGGEEEIPAMAAQAVADAPSGLTPLEVIEHLLRTLGSSLFDGRLDYVRQRRAVIAADPSLRERELRKLANLSDAITTAFRTRGLDEIAAMLAAETAVTVFKVSLQRWLTVDSTNRAVGDSTDSALPSIAADTLQELRALR